MFEVFYNQAIRKMTVAFGSLFNNVYVQRLNSSGDEDSRIRVPLGYGPKEKYILEGLEKQAQSETQGMLKSHYPE